MYQICGFGTFQDTTVIVFGAFFGKQAALALVGFVAFYFRVGFCANLVILVSIGGEGMTCRAGI